MSIVLLSLHAGLKASELAELKPTDVKLGTNQVKVTRSEGKRQFLHLNDATTMVLARYLATKPQSRNGRFFVGLQGQELSRGVIYKIVRKYLDLAGIDRGKHGPDLLRHTFCTRLYRKGVDPFTIKELAGYKKLETTFKYIPLGNDGEYKAVDQLQLGIS